MKASLINSVIQRFRTLFPDDHGISADELNKIEDKLHLIFPWDFKEISSYYSGGMIGGISIFTFSADQNDQYNILNKTNYYRNCDLHLPERYVSLVETEVSFIVLETHQDKNMNTRVIYCSIEDVYNLANGNPLLYNPQIFPTFTDFFEYLLDQEEEERRENAESNSPDIL